MKVRELIEKLQALPPEQQELPAYMDYPTYTGSGWEWDHREVDEVRVDDPGGVVLS